ncbi:MAG: GntR family transcriptional regulator [Bacillota bacterium]
MEINIDRESGVPIYIQIKKQIKEMIDRGILARGDRLPPERELAEKLQVSRNRVSTAYSELEQEKVLSSQQGKGTFVKGKIEGVREASRKDKLLRIIDLAMEEALELDFSLDDFLTIAYVRAKEKEDMLSKIRVAFIECNREQLSTLIDETEKKQEIASIPILIGEMREEPGRVKKALSRVEIIVTTSFHLQEVEEFAEGMDKDIIDMTLEPRMETIVRLARIDLESQVGLVCQSHNFAREVEQSLGDIGLEGLTLDYTMSSDEELKKFLDDKDIIITSPHRYKGIRQRIGEQRQVINFEYRPDQGSINILKMALLDLKSFN